MRKQPTYILTDPNSGRHLYRRGWLGLIPLVGAFVGIGLVTLGIVRYKDRKLVLIGVTAILFTAAVYGGLFYFGEYSRTGRAMDAKLTQDIVNSLVKDIEFYKLQNGQYPDSLEQVRVNNKLAIIHDPMYGMFEESKNLHYQRSGTQYTLFSVGIDRQPNTSDDIYPTIRLNAVDTTASQSR